MDEGSVAIRVAIPAVASIAIATKTGMINRNNTSFLFVVVVVSGEQDILWDRRLHRSVLDLKLLLLEAAED